MNAMSYSNRYYSVWDLLIFLRKISVKPAFPLGTVNIHDFMESMGYAVNE